MGDKGENHEESRLVINIRGTVQGVGFRPCVYGLATAMGLGGIVANTAGGVVIEVEGPGAENFLERLRQGLPPLARITSTTVERASPKGYKVFEIIESLEGRGFTQISADVSICDDCLGELRDPEDRRHGYPFINCTNCGPRYSITRGTPYDRPNTTMSDFQMCPDCLREYEDPSDRRFHAVPNACPSCGPGVWFVQEGGKVDSPDPLGEAVSVIRQGGVLAIKGLGGFHLACDATEPGAVEKLRERKKRVRKPFAMMASDMDTVRRYCSVGPAEEGLLASVRRPVVLLEKKPDCTLPEALAPGNNRLGFMLPYTPLHYLIMDRLAASGSGVAVMTSGNMSEEPIQHLNDEALHALAPLADAFLLHDRDIFMRVDDSVLRLDEGEASPVRRSRGYAPEAIYLAGSGPDVLAVGADMKNTFTLLKDESAIVSQHLGDMDKYETVGFFEETLENLKAVYRAEPVAIAHDMHPGYGSTGWALSREGMPKYAVQHHHAHIASVMAEHGLSGNVIGVALDGTGYGPPNTRSVEAGERGGRSAESPPPEDAPTLWGGEFLLAGLGGFARLGHFGHIRLPGGEQAIRQPWRIAAGIIDDIFGNDALDMFERLGFVSRFGSGPLSDVLKVASLRQFSPLSSGVGRLFDAASALLGLCAENSFEGEAAMALESSAYLDRYHEGSYPFEVTTGQCPAIDMSGAFRAIALGLTVGAPVPTMAMAFHNTIANAVAEAVAGISQVSGVKRVALSGGVFQNALLLRLISGRLTKAGLDVYTNRLVPPNDACISLGQAVVLRHNIDKVL